MFRNTRRGRPMWRPGERRADDCKFVFCPSRGPDFRKRTGDISPPGEVLSMDGKYPKIPGSADPDPERTFGKRSEFVRRGHELGADVSSARCRSRLSNHTLSIFSPSRLSYALPFRLYLVGAAPCGGPRADDIRPYKFYRHVPQPYTLGGWGHPPLRGIPFVRCIM